MSDENVRVLIVANHFERMVAELVEETREVVKDVADDIEHHVGMQTRAEVADTLKQQTRRGGLERTILVGDKTSAFDPGFSEYGTVDQAASPIVTPAAEGERARFTSEMRRIESKLKKVR